MNAEPDREAGSRDARHGYRPWPNSGRDEPASAYRVRRPSLAESLIAKIRSNQAIVGEDVIVIRILTARTACAVARHLQRGQLIFLESSTASTRKDFLARLLKTGKAFLLAWSTPRGLSGLDDDSRRAAAALVDALDPS